MAAFRRRRMPRTMARVGVWTVEISDARIDLSGRCCRRRSGSVAAEVFGPMLGLAYQKLIRGLAVNHPSRAGN
jgi:hypothetical protein